MAKKNQLVEAKNPPEKKKKESQTSAPEQIQIFEELERKKKVKLSIVSYAIGVCAVLLLVLFIARWAGSDAWFTVICDFTLGLFSWAAVSLPALMIYSAWFIRKIAQDKKHIWNLILSGCLLITVSVLFGLILHGEASMTPADVYRAGKSGTGGGLFGCYISWLFTKALSRAGAWVLCIALMIAFVTFLIGLTLDDAGRIAVKILQKLWGKIKSVLFERRRRRKAQAEAEAEEEEAEEDDDAFVPPSLPKKGSKYYNKPVVDPNPYAEKTLSDSNPSGEKTPSDPRSAGAPVPGSEEWAECEDEEDTESVSPLPKPQVVPRPDAPKGWGEGEQNRIPRKQEELPKVKQKGAAVRGSIDLDDIFSENNKKITKQQPVTVEPIAEEAEEAEEEEDLLEAAPAAAVSSPSEEELTARRTPLMSVLPQGEAEEAKKQYTFPPVSLLTALPAKQGDVTEELRTNANRLVETLRSFKVRTKVVNVSRGPTITRYELQPEEGVRVRAIANLVDDISLNLATSGVRIEAPIPGKAAVGVEVPNKNRETVYLRTLLDDNRFIQSPAKLTAAIGVDVAGDPIYVDLAKMPHLLIAGTTGSGKSVCLNCLILSMLYKATPDEVKLIMIDPKKVEFNVYNGLPHLIIPVVSSAKKAAGALSWAVSEMERRYELIETVGVRDIKNYNRITANDPDKEYMPQLVIIIDELADLMMTAPTEVEESICRIAQKGRACGMHLIIGTQRPSVDVITGLIKANVPSRVAFTVSSQVDSRTIIDIAGAEKLIGRGDMLFAPIGAVKPMRLQGAFVSDEEVEEVTSFIINHSEEAVYDDKVLKDIEKEAELCGTKGKKAPSFDGESVADGDGENDPMLKAAIDLAVESGKISTSLIQRRLSLGYGRAAKLIDEMEQRGIVSPPEGQKPRTVLISASEWHEMCMRSEG